MDPNRGTTAERGYDAKHRQWRTQVLARDPLCQYRYPGCTIVSTVSDHVVRIADGGARFALSNGKGCCRHCHAIKSQRESRA